MVVPGPLPEDMGRDAAGDYAACEAASGEPWVCEHPRTRSREPAPSPSIIKGQGHELPAHCYGRFEDADFIAVARTALPAWIRRAVEAEAENAALKARVGAAANELLRGVL